MASSVCPFFKRLIAMLLWAIQLSGFLEIVAHQSVSESEYIAHCFQVRKPSDTINTPPSAGPPHLVPKLQLGNARPRNALAVLSPAAARASGPMLARYW